MVVGSAVMTTRAVYFKLWGSELGLFLVPDL